jgi:hypothetical protein
MHVVPHGFQPVEGGFIRDPKFDRFCRLLGKGKCLKGVMTVSAYLLW